jgi:hypothetical protein
MGLICAAVTWSLRNQMGGFDGSKAMGAIVQHQRGKTKAGRFDWDKGSAPVHAARGSWSRAGKRMPSGRSGEPWRTSNQCRLEACEYVHLSMPHGLIPTEETGIPLPTRT